MPPPYAIHFSISDVFLSVSAANAPPTAKQSHVQMLHFDTVLVRTITHFLTEGFARDHRILNRRFAACLPQPPAEAYGGKTIKRMKQNIETLCGLVHSGGGSQASVFSNQLNGWDCIKRWDEMKLLLFSRCVTTERRAVDTASSADLLVLNSYRWAVQAGRDVVFGLWLMWGIHVC